MRMFKKKAKFKKATEVETMGYFTDKNYDNYVWSRVGHAIVLCPSCNHKQNVQTLFSTKCRSCNKSYIVFPENKPPRVIGLGNEKYRPLFINYVARKRFGKFNTIL